MMIFNKDLAKTMLMLSLTLFNSIGLAKTEKNEFSESQTGIASYFNDKYHGKKTASGELYNKNALTTTHATLPFGTILHVVNLQNNRSVDVRVNSRAHKNNRRLLDLSKQAAKDLDFLQAGIARVKITILSFGEA
jgi:rare lipoprotein A